MANITSNRILFLDGVKCFTIYLVVLGHVLGQMNGQDEWNVLASFIYSFHMPLFMMLSGYFFSKRFASLPMWDALVSKAKQLLLPAATMIAIVLVYRYFFREGHLNLRNELIGGLWFLKTLFVIYVVVYLLKKIHRNEYLLLSGACVILWILPPATTLQINWLFPFFCMGYLLKKQDSLRSVIFSGKYATVFCIIFIGAFIFQYTHHIPNYISINVHTLPSEWYLILLRYFVATMGCASVISAISAIYVGGGKSLTLCTQCGQLTLGIYVVQTLIVETIFPDTIARVLKVENEWLLDLIVAPVLAVLSTALCIVIIRCTSRSKIIDCVLYGGQYNDLNKNT